jgi:PPOX class probable F420-dependent enzyme
MSTAAVPKPDKEIVVKFPEAALELLDAPEAAGLATVQPDGSPQVSVVWFRREGDELVFSTVRGRRKARNLERDPRATLLVTARGNPYRYVEVRGTVTMQDDPAGRLIDELSRFYKGVPWTADVPGTARVIVRLRPAHVVVH